MAVGKEQELANEAIDAQGCRPVAVMVDDNPNDRSAAELLSGAGLPTIALAPADTAEATAESIRGQLGTEPAGLILLDYRLEEAPGISFRGGSVAAGLREFETDWPVVLYTTAEKLRRWVQQQPTIHELFDWQLLKHEIVEADHRSVAVHRLIDIACGYANLREVVATEDGSVWDVVADAMRCEAEELAPFKAGEEPPRTVSGIGRWLLRDILPRVGPLIGPEEARVILGVDAFGFAEPKIMDFVGPARYTGVFDGLERRWFRQRLFDLLEEAEIKGDARQRAERLSEVLAVQLQAEACSWCGRFGTVRPCAVCRRAVDAAHALPILDDPSLPRGVPRYGDPPRWAAQPLACYRCIVEGRAETLRFAESSKETIEELRTTDVISPADGHQQDDA